MKMLSANQLKFAAMTAGLTIVFLTLRIYYLSQASATGVWSAAFAFFGLMLCNGWYFGKKDTGYLPLANSSLRFHVLTFVVFNFINLFTQHYIAGGISSETWLALQWWAVGLALHVLLFWMGRKKRVNGIRKSDIFE